MSSYFLVKKVIIITQTFLGLQINDLLKKSYIAILNVRPICAFTLYVGCIPSDGFRQRCKTNDETYQVASSQARQG